MRTGILIVGIVLLIVGIALVIIGAIGALGSTTIITSYSSPSSGEYVSSEMSLNSTNVIVVTSPPSVGGLIPAQDLSSVSSTNIASDVVSPQTTAGGAETYRNLSGNYYYVIFSSSSQPPTKIVITGGHFLKTAVYGILILVGIVLFVAGIAVAIIGAVMKKKPSRTPPPAYPSSSVNSPAPTAPSEPSGSPTQAGRFCTKCGASLPAGVLYCPACGASQTA